MSQSNYIKLEDLMRKRFLFENIEVQLTGRYAKKPSRRKEVILFEIRPSNPNESWKRWLRLEDMYEIHRPLDHKVEFAPDLMEAIRRVKNSEGD